MRALAIAALLALPGLAGASERRADASLQLAVTRHGTFDDTDVGVGAQLSYRLTGWLAADGHFNWFPGDLGQPAFSSSRTQGLLGLRVGPHLDRASLYAAARPGFLRFSEAPAPFPCILIYPPPLGCSLASGTTAFTMDLAAGYQALLGEAVVVRLEVGDGLVRYPGPALDVEGAVYTDPFWKHSLRLTLAVGLRF